MLFWYEYLCVLERTVETAMCLGETCFVRFWNEYAFDLHDGVEMAMCAGGMCLVPWNEYLCVLERTGNCCNCNR